MPALPDNARDSQILEYALFISKVEAAAKGMDKAEDKKRIAERLELFGFIERPTKDDGNCQFCAVSDQLFGNESRAGEIRQLAVHWLRHNKDWNPSGQRDGELHKFINDEPWEDYLQRMAKDKVWGDHLTLIAVAEVFHISIFIISSVPGDKFITQINPGAQESLHSGRKKTIFLAHHLEFHYVSIVESQDVSLSLTPMSAAYLERERNLISQAPQLPALHSPSSAPPASFAPPAFSHSSPPPPASAAATSSLFSSPAGSGAGGKTLKLMLVSKGLNRRLPVANWPSLPELDRILHDVFRSDLPYDYILKYKDEEGDLISISRQMELDEAIGLVTSRGNVLSLEISDYPRLYSSVPRIPPNQPLDSLAGASWTLPPS